MSTRGFSPASGHDMSHTPKVGFLDAGLQALNAKIQSRSSNSGTCMTSISGSSMSSSSSSSSGSSSCSVGTTSSSGIVVLVVVVVVVCW